jgi:hypothetical protein
MNKRQDPRLAAKRDLRYEEDIVEQTGIKNLVQSTNGPIGQEGNNQIRIIER